jgi:hypothetical protein
MSRRYLTAATYREQAARLTERDLAVLKCVAELRFVSGSQLTRLCFNDSHDQAANARAARRALLRLTRLEALTRLPRMVGGVRSGSAGFVYYLGLFGQRLAVTRGWQPERRGRRSLTPGTLFVRHSLQVAELHTLLVQADRSRRIELLERCAEPVSWRPYSGNGTPLILKPDSFVRLGLGAYEDSYFIEIDRGSEGSRTIERQLRAYLAYYQSGQEQAEHGVFPRVLWLAPDDRRANVIAACVQRLPASGRALFQVALFDQALSVLLGANTA